MLSGSPQPSFVGDPSFNISPAENARSNNCSGTRSNVCSASFLLFLVLDHGDYGSGLIAGVGPSLVTRLKKSIAMRSDPMARIMRRVLGSLAIMLLLVFSNGDNFRWFRHAHSMPDAAPVKCQSQVPVPWQELTRKSKQSPPCKHWSKLHPLEAKSYATFFGFFSPNAPDSA